MLKQTSVNTFMQSSNVVIGCVMLFARYLPSTLSKVATRYLRNHVFVTLDDYSSRASNVVVCSRLERCSRLWVSVSAQVLVYVFLFLDLLILTRRSSGFTSGDNCTTC